MPQKTIRVLFLAVLLVACSRLPVIGPQPSPTPLPVSAVLAEATPTSPLELTPDLQATLAAVPPAQFAQGEATRFKPQPGTPLAVPSFLSAQSPCDWMGVGGQVFNLNGDPVTGLVVQVSGQLSGQDVLALGVTGGSTAFGPGGYQIQLAGRPVASQGTLALQVFDLHSSPLSDPLPFDTFATCEQNLILFNLVEFRTTIQVYLPFVQVTSPKFLFLPWIP